MDKQDKTSHESRDQLLKRNNTTPADVQKAHDEADKDIAKDPDFSSQSPNDDLDEGELARVGRE